MAVIEDNSGVVSSLTVAMSRGFMFAVKRLWLSIHCRIISSRGSG